VCLQGQHMWACHVPDGQGGGAPRHAVGASGMGVMASAMSIHVNAWSTFRLAVLVLLLLMLVAISVLIWPALWAYRLPSGEWTVRVMRWASVAFWAVALVRSVSCCAWLLRL
jgi:hypothetical protein